MDQELNNAFHLVSQANNQSIKQGEALLTQLKKNCHYPMALLIYMENNSAFEAQLRAVIQLKLWCESYKDLEQYERKFYQQIIEDLKEKIVRVYLVNCDPRITKTIRPAIVALTVAEYPRNWQGLVASLVKFASQNPNSILPILELIKDITYKYSYMGRSDPLYQEIILVCDQTHDFLLQLTLSILQLTNTDDGTFTILTNLMQIFYHLNYQDLHPKFQDNLNSWMQILKQVMNYANSTEIVFKCKGAALESILLYANKYKQDVQSSIKGFSSEIWDLCSNATSDADYDQVVFNCLKYFKSIVLWKQMEGFFKDNMATLIQKLIMPNLKITKKIIQQMFIEQPDVFFDFYFKNSDIHTRRAASLQLLRTICRHFPNYQGYLVNLIKSYNPECPLQQKCDLLNFIIDGSGKNFRQMDGCTDVYIDKTLISQCYEHIIKSDLAAVYNWILQNQGKNIQDQINMTLLVTLFRYVYYFRVFIGSQNYTLIIKFTSAINTKSESVRLIVYMMINSFLSVRTGDFTHYKNFTYFFDKTNTHEVAQDVLKTIYKNDTNYTVLNPELTKMVYTLAKTLGAGSVQYFEYFKTLFKQMLDKTQNYDFRSVMFLFQAIGQLAFWLSQKGGEDKQKLEAQVFQFFYKSVKDKSDLLNFCFQILAIFLNFQNQNAQKHKNLYESVINIENWTEQNISVLSSYIQYISGYLSRSQNNIITDKQKFQIILSKLVGMEHFDLFYRFLNSILKISNIEGFEQSGYFKLATQGTQAIIQKSIQGKKKGFMFLFKLMGQYNTKLIIDLIIQMAKYSPRLLENVVNSGQQIIQTMQNRRDRKLMYTALMQGNLMSLLIDNSTNRFSMASFRENALMGTQTNESKKQATYQKLTIFKHIDAVSQAPFENFDDQYQLCKAYMICQTQNRQSLQFINPKNHQRMVRLLEKHKNIKNDLPFAKPNY